MAHYLLSTHTVAGEARDPMSDDGLRRMMERIGARSWPREGLPPNPCGWITTTARNHAIDRLRRESRGRELLRKVAALSPAGEAPGN